MLNNTRHVQMTDEQETLDEMYERIRIEALPEEQQRLVALHKWNALQATSSYLEEQARRFVQEKF